MMSYFAWNDSWWDKIQWQTRLLTSAVFLPIRSISTTVNQAIRVITDSATRATGNYRNQNRLETVTCWNDRDRSRKQKSPQWWLMVGSLWISPSTNNMNLSAACLAFHGLCYQLIYLFLLRKPQYTNKTQDISSESSSYFLLDLWVKT